MSNLIVVFHSATSRLFSRSEPGRLLAALLAITLAIESLGQENARLDPAAWGSDHVGKLLPQYMTGDECLFCHRDIGPTWHENRHQLTIRPVDGEDVSPPTGTSYLLGSRRTIRFLKRSEQYGKLDLWRDGRWDEAMFADRCAGCHTTAVDSTTRAFSALSLDCFTCHGDVPLQHTEEIGRVLLSSKNQEPREVMSICGQCHLRGGNSASSRLPYPNQFVAGDNLFRDFRVDFSLDVIDRQPVVDRHIYHNTRDVVVLGHTETTCLTCHDVHDASSEKHQSLENAAICATCHVEGTDNTRLVDGMRKRDRPPAHSQVCDY